MDDIFDDGSLYGQQRFQPLNQVTQVYRAETSTPQPPAPPQRPTSLLPPPPLATEKSDFEADIFSRPLPKWPNLEEESETSPAEVFESMPRPVFDENLLNKVTTPKSQQLPTDFGSLSNRENKFPGETLAEKTRCRSRSENIPGSSSNFLDPLDISFEDEKSFEERSEELWIQWQQNGHYLHSPGEHLEL